MSVGPFGGNLSKPGPFGRFCLKEPLRMAIFLIVFRQILGWGSERIGYPFGWVGAGKSAWRREKRTADSKLDFEMIVFEGVFLGGVSKK